MYMCYLYEAHVELCRVCDMRWPQMGRRSAGLSRATPSVHMLNPSCYLSVCLSPLLLYIAHMARMLDGAPVVRIICLMVPWRENGSVWEPHWHIRSSVCLIGLKPSALNPKQNEQAVWWLLRQPPGFM